MVMKRIIRRTAFLKLFFVAVLIAFLALNWLAWMQAWNFSHFVPEGQPPPRLDRMSFPERLWLMAVGVSVAKAKNEHTPGDLHLPYQEHRIPLENGESLEAWWIPQTAPRGVVLMFHG